MTSTQIVLFVLTSLYIVQGYADDSSVNQLQTELEDAANELTKNVDDRSNDLTNEAERQSSEAMKLIQSSVDNSLRGFNGTIAELEASGVNISGCGHVIRDLGIELLRNPAKCVTDKIEEVRNIVQSFRDIAENVRTSVEHVRIAISVCDRNLRCSADIIGKAMIKISLQGSRVAALGSEAGVIAGTLQFSVLGCVTAALSDSPSLVTKAGDKLAACIADTIDDTPPTTPAPADVDTPQTTPPAPESIQ
ncbi:uncharacterized protein [Anabrus simplex]|uniref:uncharacterized protein n=1 Tax=Anabrus simplex TaxID=316456 RepID=UPI0035A39737